MKIVLFPRASVSLKKKKRRQEKMQMASCTSECEKKALRKIRRFNKRGKAGC